MFVSYFTEQPMSAYPEEMGRAVEPDDHPGRESGDTALLFSNRHFDAEAAHRLYGERFEQYQAAEAAGFDGIMTNEHHATPYSMSARCNIISAFVAAITERVKIVQMGNPLPLWENPVQLAEEIAMLDLASGGRVVAGMVRGGGTEQLANNINPVFNRDRFAEAHDLIVKTWTTPGPFRWEGDHYQVRVVNPWVLPLQKPHPRIWVPGVTSTQTIEYAAEHGYPYLVLNSTIENTKRIWDLYDSVAAKSGYTAGPEHRGYLMRIHVADSEETARRNAEEFCWMTGDITGLNKPVWAAPAGYTTWEARRARVDLARTQDIFDGQVADGTIIYGTPTTVLPKVRRWLEETRPGILMLWANDGTVSQRDSLRCIELLGEEVIPAMKEIAQELELHDPFSIDAPVSAAHYDDLVEVSG